MKPVCLGCTVTVFNEPGSAMGLRSLSEAQKRVLQGTKAQRQAGKMVAMFVAKFRMFQV